MADKTGIEWTDATWNAIRGCSRVSEGCRNCYAESVANRFKGKGQPYDGLIAKGGQWNGNIKVADHLMDWPLRKKKPQRIFVNSMSDLFHENVPDATIDRIFAVMALAHWHTFQVLTKRPVRMRDYMQQLKQGDRNVCDKATSIRGGVLGGVIAKDWIKAGLPNVWLGVSVEDQETADERIPLLLQTPAAVRWVSAEPLLEDVTIFSMDGPVDVPDGSPSPLHWVVVGGESGKNARPMHPNWARSLRDHCEAAGVPFLFKQWGEWVPQLGAIDLNEFGENSRRQWATWDGAAWEYWNKPNIWDDLGDEEDCMVKVGKKTAGRMLDGVLHDEYPPTKVNE